jgi:hypothetical protein
MSDTPLGERLRTRSSQVPRDREKYLRKDAMLRHWADIRAGRAARGRLQRPGAG